MWFRYCWIGFALLCFSCKTSYTVLNKGISGHNSANLLARVDRDVNAFHPDLVLLMVGTNDMINSKKFLSNAQYLRNVKGIVDKLRQANPKVKIVMASILPVEEEYLFQRHDPALFSVSPNDKINALNQDIQRFAQQEQLYFIPLHDEFSRHGLDFKSAQSLLVNAQNGPSNDGVHPTAAGYQLIGDYFYAQLKAMKLLKRKMLLLCFGDSITYGAFMEGKGTASGDTYPAVLNRRLQGITK